MAKKLGIVEGSKVLLRHAPSHYRDLIAPIPTGVSFPRTLTKSTDIVHLFSSRRDELEAELQQLRKSIRSDAVIWVSWPKKAAKIPTDITEATIRELALAIGLVDIKVCAVNDVWSGLKLMIRRELR